MRGQSIVLIGFMGAGKSSTGAALAKQTGLPRFDTDELVSKRLGLSVPEIFRTLGEETFRDSETRALSGLMNSGTGIIVTGGGIVLRPDNVKMLRTLGTVVFLESGRGNTLPEGFGRSTATTAADRKSTIDVGGIVAGA